MRLILNPSPGERLGPAAVALGFFDGVHLGHQQIIRAAVDYARMHGLKPAVLSLNQHPRALTVGAAPALITDRETKLALLEDLGVELAVLVDFNTELMNTSAEDYMQRYLRDLLDAQYVSVGFDHHFGKQRSGSPDLLRSWGQQRGIAVEVAQRVSLGAITVSSSIIRSLLSAGDIAEVNQLLGRNYSLSGMVVRGDGRGRKLGYPTANIKLNPELIVPAAGVYIVNASSGLLRCARNDDLLSLRGASHASLAAGSGDEAIHCLGLGLVNIGTRPTFKLDANISCELYLPDMDIDLYDQELKLEFHSRLRDERKFAGAEQLIKQIELDLAEFRKHQGRTPTFDKTLE